MYIYISGILLISTVLFLLYKFYPKINDLIKKYIIPFQQVKQIKQKMKDLEENEMKEEKSSHNTKIMENIHEILYLPVDFLYKLMITNVIPLFYTYYQ
jgi:uncharacterized membrane protein (DUF106 family)